MDPNTDTTPTFNDPLEFDLERQKLARRRRIAESLLQTPIETIPGQMISGRYVAPNPGEYFNQAMQKVLASRDSSRLDEEEQALARREAETSRQLLSSIPANAGPERLNAQIQAARNPSLRDLIKMQMLADENEAKRLAANDEKEAARAWQEQQNQIYKRTLEDQIRLKQTPSVIEHVGGAGKDPEDIALDRQLKQARINALANPKPTASESKSALAQDELVGKIDNALAELDKNPNAVGFRTLVPNIALNRLDPEGTAARSAIAELGAEKAHSLYGASFTAAERARADQFIPAAGDDIATIRTKLDNMKKLAVAARARASAGKQSGASGSWGESPRPRVAPPAVGEVRNGYRFNGGDPKNQANWEAVK